MFKRITLVVLAFLGLTFGLVEIASAASVIPAESMTKLTADGTATMTDIGGGMLGLGVVAVLFKWAKAALFG